MPLTRTVDPASLPVSLQEIHDHVGVTDLADNDRLTMLNEAATRHVERISRRQLITQTWREKFDNFSDPIIVLQRRPLQTVTSITYVDNAGDTQTFSNTLYDVDTDADPGRIILGFNESWPTVRGHTNDVAITYVCGYGTDGSSVPSTLKAAIKLLVGNWSENREATISGTIIAEVPLAVVDLIMAERDYGFQA